MSDPDGPVLCDGGLGRQLAGPPELHDVRVGVPPHVDDALQLVLRDGAVLVHALHGSDASLVAAGKHGDLALLPEAAVHAVLHDRHVVHHGSGGTIHVAAVPEGLQRPLLTGQPCDHAGFDGREVRDDEPAAVRRDEGRPDQLGEDEGCLPEEGLHGVEVTGSGELSGQIEIRQRVLREVVRLHQSASPAPGAVGSVELEDPAKAVILADGCQHRAVLGHAGLAERRSDLQHPPDVLRKISGQRFRDGVLRDAGHLDALAGQPFLQLGQAVRVAEARDGLGLFL